MIFQPYKSRLQGRFAPGRQNRFAYLPPQHEAICVLAVPTDRDEAEVLELEAALRKDDLFMRRKFFSFASARSAALMSVGYILFVAMIVFFQGIAEIQWLNVLGYASVVGICTGTLEGFYSLGTVSSIGVFLVFSAAVGAASFVF